MKGSVPSNGNLLADDDQAISQQILPNKVTGQTEADLRLDNSHGKLVRLASDIAQCHARRHPGATHWLTQQFDERPAPTRVHHQLRQLNSTKIYFSQFG